MTARTANVLRIATFVVFALVALVLVYRFAVGSGDDVDEVELGSGELQVDVAIAVAGRESVTVRGYVFSGPGSAPLRICNGIERGSPPRCIGPYLALEGVNEGSFNFREGEDDGRPMKWVPDPVALHGRIAGTVMTVDQILN